MQLPDTELVRNVRVALMVVKHRPAGSAGALKLLRKAVHEGGAEAAEALLALDYLRAAAKSAADLAKEPEAARNAAKLVSTLLEGLAAAQQGVSGPAVPARRSPADAALCCFLGVQAATRLLHASQQAARQRKHQQGAAAEAGAAAVGLLQQALALLAALPCLPAEVLPEERVALQELSCLLWHPSSLAPGAASAALALLLHAGHQQEAARHLLCGEGAQEYRGAVDALLADQPQLAAEFRQPWKALLVAEASATGAAAAVGNGSSVWGGAKMVAGLQSMVSRQHHNGHHNGHAAPAAEPAGSVHGADGADTGDDGSMDSSRSPEADGEAATSVQQQRKEGKSSRLGRLAEKAQTGKVFASLRKLGGARGSSNNLAATGEARPARITSSMRSSADDLIAAHHPAQL